MNRSNIITLPNPHLRQRSKKINIVTDEVRTLIENMKAATLDWEDHREHEVGVALAAVQVDQLYRLVVVREDFDDKDNRNFIVFINPTIAKAYGKIIEDFEGCLSIKDVYGKVPRFEKVKVDALNEEGRPFRVTAEGFLARVFQHEIDHTNGVVFIDHIKEKEDAFFQLNTEGKLKALSYDEIMRRDDLWTE